MKRNLWMVISAVWMAFVSCGTVKWVSIDRLVPAQMDLSSQVRRVAVLNCQPKMDEQSFESSPVFWLDSKGVADTLAQYLADAAYFDEVVVSDNVLSADSYYKKGVLRPSAVEMLCKTFGVDMLVTVENVSFMPYGITPPFVKGQVWSDMACYVKGGTEPIATIQKHYTFDWEDWQELKSQAVCMAALWALPIIVPQWQLEEFPFYTGANIGQRDAAVYVREGNWDGAASLWCQQLTHRRRVRRMEAHLNMAVYHEMKDDSIGTALKYAQEALKLSEEGQKMKDGKPVTPTFDHMLISDYLKNLERRGHDLERIKRQMHRFSDDF